MYSHLIGTFVAVVETGSFSKASDRLFLSRVSVMKQMDTLESRVGVRLLNRSSTGTLPTEAGKLFYEDAKRIMKLSDEAMVRIRRLGQGEHTAIRIASSFLNPARPFLQLWNQIQDEYPQFVVRMVEYKDEHDVMGEWMNAIGEEYDLWVGISDSLYWNSVIDFLELCRCRIACAVPRNHRLATRDHLVPADLAHETVMMVKKGNSPENDRLRAWLTQEFPYIRIADAHHYYDVDTFYESALHNRILLSFRHWDGINPSLVTLPVEWDFTVPYGIISARKPSPQVASFLQAVRSSLHAGKIRTQGILPE